MPSPAVDSSVFYFEIHHSFLLSIINSPTWKSQVQVLKISLNIKIEKVIINRKTDIYIKM